uniref:PepSY domain-containing protein n=1 Tax=Haptolina brevifila TaxID=156173 RepID=A0A7S2BN27_9EUKA
MIPARQTIPRSWLMIAAIALITAAWHGDAKPWAANLFSHSKQHEVEVDIPLDQLPAAVLSALTSRYPNATIIAAELENQGNHVEYEVTIEVDGVEKEIELATDGRIEDEDDD